MVLLGIAWFKEKATKQCAYLGTHMILKGMAWEMIIEQTPPMVRVIEITQFFIPYSTLRIVINGMWKELWNSELAPKQPDGCGRQSLHHWVTWTQACCAYSGQAPTEHFIFNARLLLANEVSQKIENCKCKYKNIIEFQ